MPIINRNPMNFEQLLLRRDSCNFFIIVANEESCRFSLSTVLFGFNTDVIVTKVQ